MKLHDVSGQRDLRAKRPLGGKKQIINENAHQFAPAINELRANVVPKSVNYWLGTKTEFQQIPG